MNVSSLLLQIGHITVHAVKFVPVLIFFAFLLRVLSLSMLTFPMHCVNLLLNVTVIRAMTCTWPTHTLLLRQVTCHGLLLITYYSDV